MQGRTNESLNVKRAAFLYYVAALHVLLFTNMIMALWGAGLGPFIGINVFVFALVVMIALLLFSGIFFTQEHLDRKNRGLE